MKKCHVLCLCLSLLFCSLFSMTVLADTGPKPSVVIDFKGLEEVSYYATLLSETNSTGPWSTGDDYMDWMGEKNAFDAFDTYQDAEGFYFLGWMEDCSDDQQLRWGYYPPAAFKILLYFPESGKLLSSEKIYERYAFDSYFTAEVIGETIIVEKTYDFTWEVYSLLCRIIATIGIELAVAWLFFGFRKREQIKVICIANLTTQTILNVLLNIANYNRGAAGFVLCYILLEFLVFMIEAIVYHSFLRNTEGEKKIHPVLYAFIANSVSFGIGILVAKWMPGIF